MASSVFSPSPSTVRQKRYGQYAESSSKTLIGLQKVNVQLQKEIDSLEKQKKTAVNNIANHQQALKMSWRRLEQQRNMAGSPQLTRATTAPTDAQPRQPRKGLLQSNTRLYVNSTPQVYDSSASTSSAVQLTFTPTEDETERPSSNAPTTASLLDSRYVRSSPYISSPFMLRKEGLPRILTPSPLASSGDEDGASDGRRSSEELKLPIIAPKSQKAVTLGGIVDKQALMEASMLLGVNGTNSKGPGVFQSFYSDAPGVNVRSIVVSPLAEEARHEGEEQKEDVQ